ncbi:pantetheine-phosphate adenylyltransferase [Sporosalibacterium faouarense]|uniref:pantetheine-phosphate adenylyltransferase n=1 Tax=Sporosalibacterium faouarense TaxID=516123 RepID=UPI00141CE8D0|nr:pantetheine-phosphate adenylyltransferase [Sporosalibacterium faouarense]MTI47711.1 pantetheine-phosphate adenylyltransferase [Bacillota bacterium]
MKVIYPGSFDPITNGHLDIVERCSQKFDKVILAILNNSAKNTLFTVDERLKILESCIEEYDNVEVDTFSGLLVDYAREKGITTVIRGLRAVTDFEYELQMALMNRELDSELDTLFLMSSSQYAFLSSSLVKEVAKYDGDITRFVPKVVEEALHHKMKGDK